MLHQTKNKEFTRKGGLLEKEAIYDAIFTFLIDLETAEQLVFKIFIVFRGLLQQPATGLIGLILVKTDLKDQT